MRINQIKNLSGGMPVRMDEPVEHGLEPLRFHRTLTTLTEQNHEKHVRQSIEEIFRQGELLAQRADLMSLSKYREMVRRLMEEAVGNGFAFSKFSGQDRRGRHRVYALIHRINERLEGMAQEMLDAQADNLALLNAVSDIRGLLIDLFL